MLPRDTAARSLLPAPLQHRQPAGYGEDQRQSPERNREGRCRGEPDDRSGVARGEHCHDQHEERRHGRETSPPSPRSATGCRPRSPPPNCALHAPPARVARRDIAPRPYGRGSARSPRSVAVRPDWSLATPYLEHLIAAGVIDDPSPLTRPLRRSDVLRALETVDTVRLGRATLATVRRLKAALATGQRGPYVRVDGGAGAAAANHARREPHAAIDRPGPRRPG